jgi:parallel beta-helix repeat protein
MKRKALAVGIILLFVATAIIPSSGQKIEKQSLPGSRGNTLYVGGSGPGNYTHIQDAIDNASNRDAIFVYDRLSPYKENIIINKSISLWGENKNLTIIDGEKHGCVVTLLADMISISNFTIRNAGFHGNDDLAGVLIHSSSNLIFENIITSDTISAYGILLINSSGNMIASNVIQHNYHAGIEMRYGHNNYIIHNMMLNNSHGSIIVGWSSDNFILENNISDNICLMMVESSNNSIYKNNFIVYAIALFITNSGNNTISQNNFIRGWHRIMFFFYNIICGSNKTIQKNHWDGNYWYRQRILPKLIINHIIIDNKRGGFRIEVDWHPALKPYDIPEMR